MSRGRTARPALNDGDSCTHERTPPLLNVEVEVMQRSHMIHAHQAAGIAERDYCNSKDLACSCLLKASAKKVLVRAFRAASESSGTMRWTDHPVSVLEALETLEMEIIEVLSRTTSEPLTAILT